MKNKPITPICSYCNNYSEKQTGKQLYPHRKDLYQITVYVCTSCNASVGTHKGTDKPLGRLANPELKQAKQLAHMVFDLMWRKGSMTRKEAYKWLAEKLDIDVKKCHIGYFDLQQCNNVVTVCCPISRLTEE